MTSKLTEARRAVAKAKAEAKRTHNDVKRLAELCEDVRS